MKIGDLARGYDGWLARVLGRGEYGYRVRWETGTLRGRDALVPGMYLRRVG